ncbi:pilus assembly FimT family protein [Mucisphaera sp.]|uniref:pilus assembly FimT family protein n=1 Tax=Mucisphaera sp. TaxID=2913024 RepID=UPI003D12D04E
MGLRSVPVMRAGGVAPAVRARRGFTLAEMLLVISIIAVVMGMAAPLLRGTDASRIRDAARLLAADLDVARSGSIAHFEEPRRLEVDADGLGYRITFGDGSSSVTDTVTKRPYEVRFGEGRAAELGTVRIASHNLGVGRAVAFGIYGETSLAEDGVITLEAGGYRIDVLVDAGSGDVFLGEVSKP